MPTKASTDYYELLQVPRTAEEETIRRAYRSMATRLHPDNPDTGDVEMFLLLQQAIRVLSDPASRAKYDSNLAAAEEIPFPIFELGSFSAGVDNEKKRRLSLLALLYNRRRVQEERPSMSILELEKRLAFEREDLNFTLWYLSSKDYVKREQNGSEYALTALGADYVEAHFQTARAATAAG